MASHKQSVSSKSTLYSIGEYDNEGMSVDEDDVFEKNQNDQTIHSKCSHNSILRKPNDWHQSISVDADPNSSRRVAFEDDRGLSSNANCSYENEMALESEGSEETIECGVINYDRLEHDQDLEPILVPISGRRNFSTGRLVYMKKIDDTLAEKVFIAEKNANGLFPKLTLDQRTVHRNILNKRKPTIFQQVAKFHHKFGIRHYLLIIILALYALVGGLIFLSLEAKNELEQLETNIKQLEQLTQNLTKAVFKITNTKYNETLKRSTVFLIRDFYERMLKVEGRYIGSVYHKYELFDRLTWSYTSAIFYSMTLFTTIGYGSIACQTTAGKTLSIIYSIIGIPLMLVVLSDIGKVLLRWFTYTYNVTRRAIRHLKLRIKRKFEEDSKVAKIEEANNDNTSIKSWDSEVDEKSFPMSLTIPIVIMYLFFCSLIISVFDRNTDLNPGIGFWNAFYFSFISVSTIGLGDVLPNNIEYNPLVALMFLFGLALLSVVNTTVYETIERKLMDSLNSMEAWLESMHYYRHGREGYFVFKSLGANIQLLALALPLFDAQEEETIEAMLEPENTILGKRMFPARTRSLIAQDIDNFKPTIGILHIGNQPRRTRATTFTGSLPVHNPVTQRRSASQQCSSSSIDKEPASQRQMLRSQSERSTFLINPNFEPTMPNRIRTLSERVSSASSSDTNFPKDFYKY